jgi:hypothetical protein
VDAVVEGGLVQELWNVLLRIAGLVALVCAVAAVYFIASAYRTRREGRSALFDAERLVSNDRMMRSAFAGLAMLALTFLFFGLALISAGGTPAANQTPTRTPTRTVTPRAGATPGALATQPQPTSSLPTVPPPPPATNTPRPVVNTPAAGRKSAVVTGTAEVGGLKLRAAPNGDVIDSLPDGTVVELLGEVQTQVGIEWQRVLDPKGREGWVASQYLIINP